MHGTRPADRTSVQARNTPTTPKLSPTKTCNATSALWQHVTKLPVRYRSVYPLRSLSSRDTPYPIRTPGRLRTLPLRCDRLAACILLLRERCKSNGEDACRAWLTLTARSGTSDRALGTRRPTREPGRQACQTTTPPTRRQCQCLTSHLAYLGQLSPIPLDVPPHPSTTPPHILTFFGCVQSQESVAVDRIVGQAKVKARPPPPFEQLSVRRHPASVGIFARGAISLEQITYAEITDNTKSQQDSLVASDSNDDNNDAPVVVVIATCVP